MPRRDLASVSRLESVREKAQRAHRVALRALRRSEALSSGSSTPGAPSTSAEQSLRRGLQEAESKLAALSRAFLTLSATCAAERDELQRADRHLFIRRLAALLAWLDQEHKVTAEAVGDEPPFYVDPVHLDAYAEWLDSNEWGTVTRSSGRAFYAHFAHRVLAALRAMSTEEHLERVRLLRKEWET